MGGGEGLAARRSLRKSHRNSKDPRRPTSDPKIPTYPHRLRNASYLPLQRPIGLEQPPSITSMYHCPFAMLIAESGNTSKQMRLLDGPF